MTTDLASALKKAITHLQDQLRKLQVGRASAALIEDIMVEAYGSGMALKGTANISVPDAQTLRVEPWDKGLLAAVEKGIQSANIGLNPTNMGEHLLITIPPLTEERRKQLAKAVHAEMEQARVGVRNIRQEHIKRVKIEKDEKLVSEDEAKAAEKLIQEAIDEANAQIAEIGKKKEADIMTL